MAVPERLHTRHGRTARPDGRPSRLARQGELMTDLIQWSALVGVLTPLVLAVIQQPTFPKWARVLVMVVGSCVAAIITASLQGQLDWHRWEHSVIVVATLAVVFYHGGWKKLGVTGWIEHK